LFIDDVVSVLLVLEPDDDGELMAFELEPLALPEVLEL
jgi:hypothetical protein